MAFSRLPLPLLRFLLPFCLLACPLPAQELWQRLDRGTTAVHDLAGVLSPSTESALETRLHTFWDQQSTAVAVVTLPSLEGGDIEDFATRLYERWGLGNAQTDRGALLVIAVGDRAARLEVGYGAEADLPDALARQILESRLFPALRQRDFDGGVTATVDAVLATLSGEPAPAPPSRETGPPPLSRFLPALLLFLILFSIFGRSNRRRIRGRQPMWIPGGGFGGGFGHGGFGGGGGGFGGFGGGLSGGGGASGRW